MKPWMLQGMGRWLGRRLLEAKAGLAYFLACYLIGTFLLPAGRFAGHQDYLLAELGASRPVFPLLSFHLRLILVYVVLGCIHGWMVFHFWGSIFLYRPVQAYHRLLRGVYHVLTLLAMHAYFICRDVMMYPQIYQHVLFDTGATGRRTQAWLTDRVPFGLFTWSGVVVFSACGLVAMALHCRNYLGRRRRTARRARAKNVLLLLLAACIPPAGFFLWRKTLRSGTPHTAKAPNIVLIGVDSLRADRLAHEQYFRWVMPHVDQWGEQCTVLTNMRVPLAHATASWMSILTADPPIVHGVWHDFSGPEDLACRTSSLPKRLSAQGYQTAVFADATGDVFSRVDFDYDLVRAPEGSVPCQRRLAILKRHVLLRPYLSRVWGRWLFPSLRNDQNQADPDFLVDEAACWLNKRNPSKPFFLTMHFSAAHQDYAAPHPFYQLYDESGYHGVYKYAAGHAQGTDAEPMAQADIRQVRALYDGCLRAVDHAIGRFLDLLKREQVHRNTIIAVLGIHGVNLYEAGRGGGADQHLFGSLATRVPCIIYDPNHKLPTGPYAGLTSVTDVAPTLLDLADLPNMEAVDGHALRAVIQGNAAGRDKVFSETGLWEGGGRGARRLPRMRYPGLRALLEPDPLHEGRMIIRLEYKGMLETAKHRAVETPSEKLIYLPTREGIRLYYYDLRKDPGEKQETSKFHPAQSQVLLHELQRYYQDHGMRLRRGFLMTDSGHIP